MYSKTIVRKNSYFDSVTLMSLGSKIKKLPGVQEAVVVMATEMNKEILCNVGFKEPEIQEAGVNDLIIALRSGSEADYEAAFQEIEDKLSGNTEKKNDADVEYKTIDQAVEDGIKANMAVISVPGRYAAREARKALQKGLHVMMFSDNVTVEQERELKELACEKGLLMMGPDCGTAIINGTGLCFANQVKKGTIGVVGASGTGLQEVVVQIHRLGGGIAQAIGTGGRDLKAVIGGKMMLQSIRALEEDETVEVIVLVSKPPEKEVEEKIYALLQATKKPVVVCFLEGEKKSDLREDIYFADTLFEAAQIAVRVQSNQISKTCYVDQTNRKEEMELAAKQLNINQTLVCGLFCGGTLCAEALIVLRERLGEIKSNISHRMGEEIRSLDDWGYNLLLDLGEDQFTNGRPHPMIEPSLRCDWIIKEAKNPKLGVILLDFEIGYGSHDNPAGVTAEAIREARDVAEKEGRELIFVGYICGTDLDKQTMELQKTILLKEGVILAESNVEAANLVADILSKRMEQV